MSKLSEHVHRSAINSLRASDGSSSRALESVLRLLAKWRSILIQNTLVQASGTTVQQGLLKGLDFLPHSSEGCHVAKLLGTYEQPLQEPLKALLLESSYERVINIGCAEGYYAVGLARILGDALSYAYDTDAKARDACMALAVKNNIKERVIVGELFTHSDFAIFSGKKSLVFCDIEGAEKQLLDPALAPGLAELDIVVESHECLVPGITRLLMERFGKTHNIIKIEDNGMRHLESMPAWFYKLAHLDQLLCTWEWRSGPTPWLVMRAKRDGK